MVTNEPTTCMRFEENLFRIQNQRKQQRYSLGARNFDGNFIVPKTKLTPVSVYIHVYIHVPCWVVSCEVCSSHFSKQHGSWVVPTYVHVVPIVVTTHVQYMTQLMDSHRTCRFLYPNPPHICPQDGPMNTQMYSN